jgi:hypothetical protein
MAESDVEISPVNMAQTMHICALMLFGMIPHFIKPDDSEEEKTAMTYICLAVFFHQLAAGAKHKDKMAGVLRAVLAELERPEDDQSDQV